jgi:HEAT repeat protein
MSRLIATLSLVLALLALSGCKGDPSTPAYWEKSLSKARKPQDKMRVVEDLRGSGHLNESFLPLLHARLAEERKPEVKAAVARTLAGLKSPSSVQPLESAVDWGASGTAANQLNKEVAAALGEIGDSKAVPVLVRLLKSRDNYTRVAAMESLGRLRATEAVEPLIQLALDGGLEPFLNKKAIEALGEIGDARAVPALVRMLTNERRGVSFYMESSFALFQVGQPAADALLAVLEGRDAELSRWAAEHGVLPASYTSKAAQILGDLREKRAAEALVKQLAFTHEDARIQAIVRMQAADALARMRVASAVKPVAALVATPDAGVRQGYVYTLVRLGGREALPALEKAAGQGDWYTREVAIEGLAMLGDGRELAVLEKLAAAEPALTAAECESMGGEGCGDPAALGKKRAEAIARYGQRLKAAQECGAEAGCWAKRLEDADKGVVTRAALELGRSKATAHVGALMARLSEKDLGARLALIHAVEWLLEDTQEAGAQVRGALPSLEKQLAEEKGQLDFVKVNEDLRRLVVRLQRQKT